jgi:hypothetical protein
MGWGAADCKYRFQWNFPLLFSPTTRACSTPAPTSLPLARRGASWEAISPDLTRNDKTSRPGRRPITKDNTSVEYYARSSPSPSRRSSRA